MTSTTLLFFTLTCLAVCVTPGPTTLLAFSNGAKRNWRLVGAGILGAALSDILLIAAVGLGLGVLINTSELLFAVLKWCGVAYLAWVGVQLWKSSSLSLLGDVSSQGPSAMKAFTRSLVVTLSNPKAILFITAFLPQFINPHESLVKQYAMLAAISALLDIIVMSCYAVIGAQAAKRLSDVWLTYVNRLSASVLLGLAAALAFQRRPNV